MFLWEFEFTIVLSSDPKVGCSELKNWKVAQKLQSGLSRTEKWAEMQSGLFRTEI